MDKVRTALREEWRELPEIGDYSVSNLGRVWSRVTMRELKGTPCKGYMNVRLGGKLYPIHRLVCIAFHGPPAPGMMAGHLDGNCRNNLSSNLAWITRSENTRHSIMHGTFNSSLARFFGEGHFKARLKEAEVAEIKLRLRAGDGVTEIARAFNVARTTIGGIKCGKNWRHVA